MISVNEHCFGNLLADFHRWIQTGKRVLEDHTNLLPRIWWKLASDSFVKS